MKKITTIKIAQFFLVLTLFLLPVAVLAQTPCTGSNCFQSGLDKISGSFPSSGVAGARDPWTLIRNIIDIMLFAAGAIAVVFVIIGGYQYVTSAGNDEMAEKGRKTLVNAIIGIVIIVLSYAIINVIWNFVSQGNTSFGG